MSPSSVDATAAEVLARFTSSLEFEMIPTEQATSIEARVMDTLGVCVGGRNSDASVAVRRFADEIGGNPQSQVVCEQTRLPSPSAALINGTYAHSLEFDDMHMPSVVHPSAPMVPAILAVAQASRSTGSQTIAALAAAYEINVRLSLAQYDPELRNSVFFENGLHATSIIGAVAGAAACAKLRRLDSEGILHAISVACSMGAGLLEANRQGGSVKKMHGGWAAQSAVSAAALAASGLTGPATVLEGRFGFFQAYCRDRWRPAELTRDLGTTWHANKIHFKPYPCNFFTHTIADAAIAMKRRGLKPEDVSQVVIKTALATWRTIGDPIEEKRNPKTPYHARFSAPFVFATALLGGDGLGVGESDFTEGRLANAAVRRVMSVCEVVPDEECNRIFPEQAPAIVEVVTTGGARLKEKILVNRGGAERPLSLAELRTKLNQTAGNLAPGIAQAVETLRYSANVDELMAATVE